MTSANELGSANLRPRIRRLDHVAIAVNDTAQALTYFQDTLGLRLCHSEIANEPPVRLTYLEAGNAFIQLVEPQTATSPVARFLAENGEGLHHVCFGVDDVHEALEAFGEREAEQIPPGSGRGRTSGFIANGNRHGTRLECTEFRYDLDVVKTPGWIGDE